MKLVFPVSILTLTLPALAQESRAIFDAPLVVLEEGQVPFRHLTDIDGDGDLDVLGYVDNGSYARWAAVYENDGNGVYTRIRGTSAFGFFDLSASGTGDFDGDGFDDIAQSEWEHPNARLDFLLSQDSYVRTILTDGPPRIDVLGSADLDGDGRDELLYWETTGELGFGVGQPGVDWETRSITHAYLDNVQSLQALDTDGDGGLEILVVTHANLVFVDANLDDLDGTPLTLGGTWTHGLGESSMGDVGDVDGDGDEDVVMFGMPRDGAAAEYRILRRTGPATWQLEAPQVGGPAEFLYDVDADGDLDGVCCGGGGTPSVPGGDDPTDFQIALNDGFGGFDESFRIPGVGSPQLGGVGDVDGDGDVDLVAGRCIYYARGPITRPASEAPGFRAPDVRYPRELGDFDLDGDIDAMLSLGNVEMNDGTGAFHAQAPPVEGPPRGGRFVGPGFPGDFDGDGGIDLLVELRADVGQGTSKPFARASLGANPTGRMWLLRNDGAGGLRSGGPAAPPGIAFAIDNREAYASLIADLDVDGDLDLLTRTREYGNQESRLFLNTGAGYFLPLVALPGEEVEHVADLDLDGVPDLVTTRTSEIEPNRLRPSVQRGTLPAGLPVYTPFHDLIDPFLVWTGLHPMAFGDVSGDGYLDLGFVRTIMPAESGASHLRYEPLLLVDRQSGGGYGYEPSFVLETDRRLWAGAFLAFGDVDGDGAMDVVSGPRLPEFQDVASLSVIHINDPADAFGFEPHRVQVVEPGLLVDLDGDGDLDMLGERPAENVSGP